MTIDLSKIYTIIGVLAGLITSLTVICVFLKKIIEKTLEKIKEPILNELKEQKIAILKIDENHCKDVLMQFLSDVENGIDKNEYEIARAHEVYNHYTNVLKKNSYIHARWEKVMVHFEE